MWFDELVLDAPDPAESFGFSTRALGLHAEAGPEAAVRAGRTRLVFRPAPAGAAPRVHIAFAVPLSRFDEARRRVASHAALIPDGADELIVSESWDTIGCYFRDPAGSILELIARRHAANEPAGGDSASPIQSVCEVGLAVDDVPATAAALGGALGVGPYRPGDETFTALGADSGLLIIVRRGREWFPRTGVAAAPVPLALTLTLADGTQRRIAGPPYAAVG